MAKPSTSTIKVEFTYTLTQASGGLELLFGNKRDLQIDMPLHNDEGEPSTLGDLIELLLEKYIVDSRRELFVKDGAIRPGVLVLVNDADWELEGEQAYELQDGDHVLFVSTLHGG